MNIQRADKLIHKLLGQETQLVQGDARIQKEAFALADGDHDGVATRQELAKALSEDRLEIRNKTLVPAKGIALGGSSPGPQHGLQGPHWTQTTPIPGGDPAKPPLATVVMSENETYTGTLPTSVFVEDGQYIYDLAGQSFDEVAAEANTPEEVAMFLGRNITFDEDRQDEASGTWASYSSDETLEKGTGVCRDQHALARDLLVANGYEAELLAYSASDQFHAITVYKDPQTGNWGMIEYGTIYPADQLQAKTPEEALLRVRPGVYTIWHMRNDGPHQQSVVDGTTYTRTFRTFESFMSGPAKGTLAGTTVSTQGVESHFRSPKDPSWTAGMQVVLDPALPSQQGTLMAGAWKDFDKTGVRLGLGGGVMTNNTEFQVGNNRPLYNPKLFGFVSVEESHPQLAKGRDLFGSGVDLTVSSNHKAQIMLSHDFEEGNHFYVGGEPLGLSSLKSQWGVTADRQFDWWGQPGADTRVYAGYGLGIDGGLQAAHLLMGGNDVLANQFVTAGIDTQPGKGVELSAMGYVPITNVTNDFSAVPAARLELRTPNLQLATTQSLDAARYEAELKAGKQVQVAGFGILDHDRRTGQVQPTAGIELTVHDKKKK